MKFCVDCNHVYEIPHTPMIPGICLCTHPDVVEIDMVRGTTKKVDCYHARSKDGVCGILGFLFEEK